MSALFKLSVYLLQSVLPVFRKSTTILGVSNLALWDYRRSDTAYCGVSHAPIDSGLEWSTLAFIRFGIHGTSDGLSLSLGDRRADFPSPLPSSHSRCHFANGFGGIVSFVGASSGGSVDGNFLSVGFAVVCYLSGALFTIALPFPSRPFHREDPTYHGESPHCRILWFGFNPPLYPPSSLPLCAPTICVASPTSGGVESAIDCSQP